MKQQQTPNSKSYSNGAYGSTRFEQAVPLTALGDQYSTLDQKRQMLLMAYSGGGALNKIVQQAAKPGAGQSGYSSLPKKSNSLFKQDDYSEIGGMLSNFFKTNETMGEDVRKIKEQNVGDRLRDIEWKLNDPFANLNVNGINQ